MSEEQRTANPTENRSKTRTKKVKAPKSGPTVTRADRKALRDIEAGWEIPWTTVRRLEQRGLVGISKGAPVGGGILKSWWVTRAGLKVLATKEPR